MDCPRCFVEKLVPIDRDQIEIDTCPRCRGVWLDRGELDKLIERSFRQPTADRGFNAQPALERRTVDDDSSARYYRNGRHGQLPRRRSSWLSELFD